MTSRAKPLLVLIAVFGCLPLSSSAPANAGHGSTPSVVDFMSVDVDPSMTPANAPLSLGSREACQSVMPGSMFEVDITVDEIDISDRLIAFFATVRYNPAVLQIVALDYQEMGSAFPGSSDIDASDSLPDMDGSWNLSVLAGGPIPASAEYGSGVLATLTVQPVGSGGSPIGLSNGAAGIIDAEGNTLEPGTIQHGYIGVNHPDPCGDLDADGIPNAGDLCPTSDPVDTDGDGNSNACDSDDDEDGLADGLEPGAPAGSSPVDPDSDNDGAGGDGVDKCPLTATFGIGSNADFDGDAILGQQPSASGVFGGDACDADDDNDLVLDLAEVACGGSAMNALLRPERIDLAGDDDGDTMLDEPLSPGASPFDCDGDGFKGSAEDHVYSYLSQLAGDQKTCQEYDLAFPNPSMNVKPSKRWPADLNMGPGSLNQISLLDLTTLLAPIRYFGTNVGTNPSDVRFDLTPGPGLFMMDINLQDLTAVVAGPTGYPPMLGGARAFGGPACPWP